MSELFYINLTWSVAVLLMWTQLMIVAFVKKINVKKDIDIEVT